MGRIMLDDTDDRLTQMTPEIRAMMGVFALYWKLDESIEKINLEPALSKLECNMIIRLDCPRRMGVLAKMMLTVPSSVTTTADSLEKQGFVIRSRDPEDRRAWLLQLSETGLARRREMEKQAGELFRAASGLNDEETLIFSELAGKIHDNVLRTGAPEGLKKCD